MIFLTFLLNKNKKIQKNWKILIGAGGTAIIKRKTGHNNTLSKIHHNKPTHKPQICWI